MKIQIATSQDCRAIAELQVQAWQHAYRDILPEHYLDALSVSKKEAMWHRLVQRHPGQLLVARATTDIDGFIAFGPSRDEDAPNNRAEIWAIYVYVASWSKGTGRLLWHQALKRLVAEGFESVSLWVLANNARAIRFYERAGFVLEPDSCRGIEIGGTSVKALRYRRRIS
ncbi:GNAT family N-acetyltransferase [Marinobacter sp. R17]|uniref:GNAT family N-acetyltransferase n=1 Tax=Marinobacter sp. R17 TaxID=2484250 RepID=UPI000F4BF752|nr:GNAT family N-acetyltransferase [Marinobacter sp. R17]ROU02270.1 GNAT family N-acetyltransferase [Marinobacter sp. R17]